MVLPKHVPEEAPPAAADVMTDRLPNYCHDCGGEIVVAGGRIQPEVGWYEHLDPVLTCERGCWQDRFTAGIDQDEGQEFRVAPGAQQWDDLFGGMAGWCDIHREEMVPTKDLYLADRPIRQYKCPECDRETTVTVDDG